MENRKPMIAGNWKMFKTCSEAVDAAGRLAHMVRSVRDVDIVIAPPFTALASVSEILKNTPVHTGAQNLHWETEGAYTGEISAGMLVSTGCTHVIIGHSERRQYFGETDSAVNKKIRAALGSGLTPICCIGESEKERETNNTFSVLDKQIKIGLEGLFAQDLETLILAYEPVWAIGTGKTATRDQAQEVHRFLRLWLEASYGNAFAETVRILYGGSVKPENIADLMAMPDVDGALVGGASLDPDTFSKIICYKG